jgi:hypothetical protein
MKHLLLGLVLCFGTGALADIQVSKVDGAAQARIVDGNVTIYGGTAGSCEGTGLCDSCHNNSLNCSTGPFCACNPRRISDNAVISFTVKSNSKGHFHWAITNMYGDPAIVFGPSLTGQTQELRTTWGALCHAGNDVGSCEGTTFMSNIRLGLSDGKQIAEGKDLTVVVLAPGVDTIDDCSTFSGGICNFRVQTTKKGVFLTDLESDQSFPAFIDRIRVFGSTKSFSDASPISATFTQDLNVDSDGSVDNQLDIKSKEMMFLRLATVDMGENIYNFMSDDNILNPKFGHCSSLNDSDPKSGCNYRFIPQSHK